MTDFTSTAAVATERPGRYAKQLASHFSRKIEAIWDDEAGEGRATFPGGTATLAAGDGVLFLALVAEEAEALDRLEAIVGGHLVRFGTKDELVCTWTRADGTPGTEQRNADADEHPEH